jgi:hypothetical protein
MKKKTLLLRHGCVIFYFFLTSTLFPLFSQDTIPINDTNHLVLIFTGDIMGHDGQINGAYDEATGKYNYEPTFRYISDYISDADIAVGNFEVTLAGPTFRGYPQFSSPDELAFEAKKAGYDIMAMANNHALDGGEKGFLRTLMMMDSLGFFHMGTYRDSAERANYYPLIVEKNNFRIALLNYTYGTNGLKIRLPYLINRIDTGQIRNDIEKAEQVNPDFIIVFIHWGLEYEREENADQKSLAVFMLRHGADAIIGSHPHVVQPYRDIKLPGDSLKTYPVVYSLGNFVSNQREQYKDGGIIAELHLSKEIDTPKIDSLNYLPYWVWRKDSSDGKSTFYVLPISEYELNPEKFDLNVNDVFRLNRFGKDTREHVGNIRESAYYRKKQKLQ